MTPFDEQFRDRIDPSDGSIDQNFCKICCARKVAPPEYPNDTVCCCRGLQPYAMSCYPGEHKLVPNHPAGPEEQWYKRADVDARIEELEKRLAAHQNVLINALEGVLKSATPSAKEHPAMFAAWAAAQAALKLSQVDKQSGAACNPAGSGEVGTG